MSKNRKKYKPANLPSFHYMPKAKSKLHTESEDTDQARCMPSFGIKSILFVLPLHLN